MRFLVTACTLLVLAGCSRLGSLGEDESRDLWLAEQRALRAVESWDLHARAAIRLEGEAYQVGIRWQRDTERFRLLLEAPFGQGVIRIDAAAGRSYQLRLPDGRVFENSDPEALLDDVLGWSLPIGGLEFWIRGLPWPDSSYAYRSDTAGRTRSIQQNQWSIDYLDYFDVEDGVDLPRRISLEREQLALRLVIERWQAASIEDTPSDLFPEFN